MGVVHPSSSFENFVFLMRGYDAMSLNMGGVAWLEIACHAHRAPNVFTGPRKLAPTGHPGPIFVQPWPKKM